MYSKDNLGKLHKMMDLSPKQWKRSVPGTRLRWKRERFQNKYKEIMAIAVALTTGPAVPSVPRLFYV